MKQFTDLTIVFYILRCVRGREYHNTPNTAASVEVGWKYKDALILKWAMKYTGL